MIECELSIKQFAEMVKLLFGEVSTTDPGLVGNYNQLIAELLQELQPNDCFGK